jgi:acetyl-CoA acetyltransferase
MNERHAVVIAEPVRTAIGTLGGTLKDLVEKYPVSRDAQDRWALRSQERFAPAKEAGHFDRLILRPFP